MSAAPAVEVQRPQLVKPGQSLIEKLAEACDAVGGIEKTGENKQQGYKYVKAADVAKSIRRELFKRGIVILQNEQKPEWAEFETKSGTVMKECRLAIEYIIRDSSDSITVTGYGVAMDAGDKAIYKAKTGATKYFLRGLGLIPDEKDDVEADESVDREQIVRRPSQQAQPNGNGYKPGDGLLIAPFQKNAFLSAAKKSGKSNDDVNSYLGSIGYENLDELPKTKFQDALKWAMEA